MAEFTLTAAFLFLRVFIRVSFDVLLEMVAAHEALVASGTRETLFASVSAQVTLKLIGTQETFSAKQPVADEWALSSVPAKVSLQMRYLEQFLFQTKQRKQSPMANVNKENISGLCNAEDA